MPITATPAAPKLATGFDTGASSSDGVTSNNAPTIVGTATPGATVSLYDTNGTLLGTAVADSVSGGYAISIAAQATADGLPETNLDDGVHQLTVTAAAPGLSVSQVSPPLALTIDTQVPDAPTAPTLTAASDTGASALDGVTSATTLSFTGMSEPGAIIELYDDNGATLVAQATAAADGSYAITTPQLAAGAHSFTVTATDLAGNLSKPSNVTAVTIDTAAPPAPATPSLAPGSDTGVLRTDDLTADTTPVVTGIAEAGSTVRLFDTDQTLLGTAVANADGSYAIASSTLLFGAHVLTVTATDPAGNASPASAPLDIVVQTQAATATITASPDDTASAGSTTFTITFAEPIADRRGITPDDFKLVTTGSAFGTIEQVSGHGQTGTIVVDGLGGSGTIAVELADDTQITDLAGNHITVTSTQSHDVDGTEAGDILPVSAGPSGVVGSGQDPSPSLTGRFVAFDSAFNNASGQTDVYVKDLVTGGLTKITTSLDGDPDESFSLPSLSANGSVITFVSLTRSLVPGQNFTFAANVYVATLQPADPGSGDSVTLSGPITLVSSGSGYGQEGTNDAYPDAAVVSADGLTVAFTSDQALVPGVIAGVNQVYAYDVSTGVISLISVSTGMNEYGYVEEPDNYLVEHPVFQAVGGSSPAGGGGDFDSTVTSISADGTKIAFQSYATDLGSGPLPTLNAGDTYPPQRSYVYDTKTGAITVLDGASLSPDPTAIEFYSTYDPQISADGTTVTFNVQSGGSVNTQSVFQRNLVNGITTQLTPGFPLQSGEQDGDATPSADGSYIAYDRNEFGQLGNEAPNQIIVSTPGNAATETSSLQGYQPTLTAAGNAVTFTGLLGNDTVAYEATLGVTAGIGAVGTEDEIGAAGLAAIKAAGIVTFTGTTNAPVGSLVSLQVGAQGGSPGLVTTGDVTAPGVWTVVADAADLGADGDYIVAVTVHGAAGQSPRVTRGFTLDTAAPDAPGAPKLGAGSDTGLAHDGTVTDTDTPTVTGTAEAGATVTLIDQGGLTPGMVLGTGIADGNGVYAITATALTQGAHELAVTATDEAGNVSAASEALALKVDAIVPDAPQAPEEVTVSTPGAVGEPPKISNVAVANPDGDGVITTETAPVLSGRGLPGATVTLYDTDGVSVLGTAVVGADATWSVTSSTLTDGLHKLTVTQTKASGAVSVASAPLDVTVDTLPPLSPVITSLAGPIDDIAEHTSQVDVIGTAEPGSTVQLHVDMDNLVSGTATVDADGSYEIDAMVAPGTHKLTVIATDAAGNDSQPSAVMLVTVEGGAPTPPSTASNLGKLIDGYVAGATVLYDTNGNGVLDVGESASVSNDQGLFQLTSSPATIVATGGVDTGTGYALPGALTAPAGSTVVTPLTTFLDAYASATGQSAAASLAAVNVALGLAAGTDVRLLDPVAAATAGVAAPLISSTKLMDTAIDLSAVIAGTGVSQAVAFAAVFNALAQAAAANSGPLDLSELSGFSSQPVLTSILNTAFAIASPTGTLPAAAASNALSIVGRANYDIDAYEVNNGSALPAYAQALETVVQGPVATALLAAATNPGAIEAINNTGIESQISAAQQTQYLAAPRLISASDTGESDQDNVTAYPSPVLTGTARPSSLVLLLTADAYLSHTFDVVGSGYADASGAYSIAATIVGTTSLFAIEAPAGQSAAIGAHLQVNAPDAADVVTLYTPLAAAPNPVLPVIVGDNYLAASGDGPGASALKVYGTLGNSAHETGDSVVSLYVDGGTVPVGSGSGDQTFAIVTPALANGTHTLMVTQTFFDGTSQRSAPFSVTVAAPTFITATAEAAGPLAGSDYFASGSQVFTATDQNGLAAVQAPTSSDATQSDIMFGIDTATGLRLPEPLYSPSVSAEINPLTTLEGGFPGVPNPGTFTPGLFSQALQNSRTVAALGLPVDTDLATADPLALAEAGNPALLVKSVEVLETATLLSPFLDDNFDIMSYSPSAVFTTSIDFTNPATILTWLQIGQYSNFSTGFANTYAYAASVYPAVAQIIAANNAAIEANARTATSPAAIVAFLVADERLVQSIETPALEALSLDEGNPTLQAAGFATAEAADTGQNLAAAILAQQAQTAQVTSFVPAGAAATTAPTIAEILTFSQPVTGVTAADFTVHATGLQDAQVQGVAAVPGSDGTQYDVTVQTGIGAGTLTVTYAPGTVGNADGNALPTGQFDAPTFYGDNTAFDTGPISVAIGDVDGDGIPDIVSANTYGLTVYLGLGGGQFAAQAPIAAGGFAAGSSVLLADLNGDGKPDLVTLDTQNGTLSVLLSRGDGTFGDPTIIDAGTMPTSVVAGDFSGNGETDLAIVDYGNGTGSTLRILLGNGDGTFTAGQVLSDGFGYDGKGKLLAVDLNGDGKLDLIGTFGSHGYLPVLLGNGDGTFTAVSGVPGFDNRGLQIAVGDLNGDGIPDVVLVQSTYVNGAYSSMGTVLLGNGDGSFRAGSTFVLPTTGLNSTLNGQVSTIALGNIDGTGKLDLVVETASGIEVLPGNGDGTFAPAYLVTPAGASATQGGVIAVGDLNGDGLADLVTAEQNSSSGAVYDSTGSINGIGVYLAAQQTVLAATSAPVTETRAAVANPVLSQSGGVGMLTHSGSAYTLNLGSVSQGQAMQTLVFALQNLAGSPADAFSGLFTTPAAIGFTVTGATLPGPVAAGQSYSGLTVSVDTTSLGQHTQTITFAPRDQSAPTTTYATAPGTDDVTATTSSVDGANVAAELAPITLTITDDVGPSQPMASLGAPSTVVLPNVRVGDADSQAIAVTNTAAAGNPDLDVRATAAGDATVTGAVANLAPGSSDSTDVIVGLGTATAGAVSGTVTLAPFSDTGAGVALATAPIAVSGRVFRTAVAEATAASVVLHVGDLGLVPITLRNTAAADGYSEYLAASIAASSAGLETTAADATGTIVAAGASDTSLGVTVATVAAGTVTGTATLDLASTGTGQDGSSLDGLAPLALASQAVPITVTVDNYAQAALAETFNGVTQTGTAIDLGTVMMGSAPVTLSLAALNTATGPADLLGGSFSASGSSAFSTELNDVAGIAAGQSEAAGTVTLATGTAGDFTETITFAATGSNASFYSGALPSVTVTVTGTVVAAADAYAIAGEPAVQPTTDIAAIDPFASVTLSNPNAAAFGTATVTLASTANGLLSNLGAGTLGVDGTTYTVSGSTAAIQAALRALVFTPTDHEVTPGQSVSTTLNLTVADSVSTASAATSVVATAAEDPPVIAGTQAGQAITDQQSLNPFAGVTLTDPDAGASETTTITVAANGAVGTFSGAGLTENPDGTYMLAAASPADEQAELRAPGLHPATGTGTSGSTVTNQVTLSVSDGIAATTDGTTSIVVTQAMTGTAMGDVHLVTLDGLHYDFQADGEFTLARSTVAGDPFDIQIKTTPWDAKAATSLTTQVAAQVGTNVVNFALDGGVTVNGVADTALDAAHPVQQLDGGTLTALGADDYQLDWANGEGLTVDNEGFYLNLHTTVAASDGPGSMQGLLGSMNGQANDLALPDGTVLTQPVPDATLLATFATAWSVSGTGSMLDDGASAVLRPDALGLQSAPTFLAVTAPGELLTGSLGRLGGAGMTITGSLADLLGSVITNFAPQDLIDIAGLDSTTAQIQYASSASGGVLTISQGGHVTSLGLIGPSGSAAVHAMSDLHGGTLLGLA